ncbi:MAG: DNA (cytosine-5-)-methyltransferase [Candidatus Nanopelagicales bacterium]|nr:DNA (cytosine-5-)-methyltransferase [Candidatus Nanopelagicales bacterium]
MKFGSLFAGIGGFDLGFGRAGMECAWQVENDRFCNRVLGLRWPHVARFGDVQEFAPDREHAVDLICGGFPCQDLSVAGKRAGLGGERSGLFWEFVRVASALRPPWLVLENVPGLLSSCEGRDMGTVVGALADLGYCVCWRVLDSQFFGVAQRRRRVFFVCHPDPHRAAAVLFESEGGAGDSAPMREAGADVAYRLDGGAGGVSGKENQRTIVPAIKARNSKGGFTDPVNDGIIHTLRSEGADASEDGTGRGTPIVTMPADESGQQQRPDDGSTDARSVAYNIIGGAQNSRSHAYATERSGCLQSKGLSASGNEAGTVISAPPDPAGVRTATGVPGPLDLCGVCAEGPDGPRYRALGNAVTVSVAEWIGRRIVAGQGELF